MRTEQSKGLGPSPSVDKYEPALAFEELRPGASLEGWIVFEVPRPAASVTLVYDPSFFSDDARVTFKHTCYK
jgi:hypothetical protein